MAWQRRQPPVGRPSRSHRQARATSVGEPPPSAFTRVTCWVMSGCETRRSAVRRGPSLRADGEAAHIDRAQPGAISADDEELPGVVRRQLGAVGGPGRPPPGRVRQPMQPTAVSPHHPEPGAGDCGRPWFGTETVDRGSRSRMPSWAGSWGPWLWSPSNDSTIDPLPSCRSPARPIRPTRPIPPIGPSPIRRPTDHPKKRRRGRPCLSVSSRPTRGRRSQCGQLPAAGLVAVMAQHGAPRRQLEDDTRRGEHRQRSPNHHGLLIGRNVPFA